MNTQTSVSAHTYDTVDNQTLADEAGKQLPAATRASLNEEMARRRQAILSRPDWHKQVAVQPSGQGADQAKGGSETVRTGWPVTRWASTPSMAMTWCKWMAWLTAVPAVFLFKERADLALTLLCMTGLLMATRAGLARRVNEAAYGFMVLVALLLLSVWGLSSHDWPLATGGRAAAGLVRGLAYIACACVWGAAAALQLALCLRQQGWRSLFPAKAETAAPEINVDGDR